MMNTGPIIDFIIGVIFYWYVFSGAIMQIVEYIASIGQWRSRGLYNGILHMLGNEVLADMFFQHPIILGLYGSGGAIPSRLPSYIPARQFSLVLFDILISADHEIFLIKYQLLRLKKSAELLRPSAKKEAAVLKIDKILQLCTLSDSLDFKKNESFRNLLITTVEKDLDGFVNDFPELSSDANSVHRELALMQEKIKELSGEFEGLDGKADPDLKSYISGMFVFSVLSPKLGGVFGSLLKDLPEETRNNRAVIEGRFLKDSVNWYNDAMDRLSGWYKRKSSLAALSIGILIAALFNIDSIEFARHLWRDASLQQVLRSAAIYETAGVGPVTVERLVQNGYFTIPIGWDIQKEPIINVMGCNWTSMPGFELGGYCYMMEPLQSTANGWRWLIEKVVGLLISAIAGSQGSSIWFDTLQKFVNIRLSGKKPENNYPTSVG